MKIKHLLLPSILLLLLLLTSCQYEEIVPPGHFSSTQDTLVLSSTKVRGNGIFMIGAGSFSFRDTTDEVIQEWLDYPIQYPDGVDSLKVGFSLITFSPFRYRGEAVDTFSGYNKDKSNTIVAMSGKLAGEEIYVFDQNNNQDLRDDSIRTLNELQWKPTENIIHCEYIVEKDGEERIDTSWFHIGKLRGTPWSYTSQHMVSNLVIDDYEYQIGVVDANSSSFDFSRPQIAILAEGEMERDTLLLRDYISKDEYLKLGEFYYKFEDFYNGDGTIVLVRDPDFDKKVGVQIDALAPDFEFVSLGLDTFSNNDFDKDFLLICNFSGYTRRSYDVFENLVAADINNLSIVGLESGLNVDLGGVTLDVEDPFNEDMYKKYRNWYSSYDSYLIDKEGRIVDKFSIFDWEDHLKDFIDPALFKN